MTSHQTSPVNQSAGALLVGCCLRSSMGISFEIGSGSGSARDELDGGGAGLGVGDVLDDALGVGAVLRAVLGVDRPVEGCVAVGVDKGDVLVDASRADVALVACSGAPVPAVTSFDGAYVEIVAMADDPHRHRVARRAVAA